jgi:hypothetical protein
MTDTEKTVFVYTLSLNEVPKMVEMTDAEKTALRDAIAGIRAAGVRLYAEGGSVKLEATPEQKKRIEPYVEVLREAKYEETAACLAAAETSAEPSLADADHAAERIESSDNGPKPANFIPRDGLLARCVRMLAAEGHSQARIARELRLNRRTVTRLL